MGISARVFDSGGKSSSHLQPGAFSQNIYDGGAGGYASVNNGLLIGASIGGDKNNIYRFSTLSQAKQVLKGGELLEAVKHAFTPGDGYSPQYVYAMPINNKTKSQVTFKDIDVDLLKLTFREYGVAGNSYFVRFDTVNGEKRVYFKKGTDITSRKIGRDVLAIYNQSSSNISIQKVNEIISFNIPSETTGIVDPDDPLFEPPDTSTENIRLTFKVVDYPTISDLATAIDNAMAENNISLDIIKIEQDYFKTADIDDFSAALSSDDYIITANRYELLRQLDDIGLFDVEYLTEDKRIPTDCGYIQLTGGSSDESATILDYEEALTLIEKKPFQFIVPISDNEVVINLTKAHVDYCNGRMGKAERQFLVGHSLDLSVSDTITTLKRLNTENGALLTPGFYDYDINGNKRVFSSVFYAAKEMGRLCSMSINSPSTHKTVSHLGWVKDYDDAEKDLLISNGAWIGETTPDGISRNVRSITTCQEDNLLKVEFSVMRETLFIARDLRTALERNLIGKAGTKTAYGTVKTIWRTKVSQYLNDLKILIESDKDCEIVIDGDVVKLEWEGKPTLPINFSFLTNKFSIYSSIGG